MPSGMAKSKVPARRKNVLRARASNRGASAQTCQAEGSFASKTSGAANGTAMIPSRKAAIVRRQRITAPPARPEPEQ